MRFYYLSAFSLMLYFLYLALVAGTFSAFWRLFRLKFSNPIYWVFIATVVIAPWVEELYIAYKFGELCRKDAGTYITKAVEVEGFYDDTTHWWRQLAESQYRFVESKDVIYRKLWRVERAGDEIRHFEIKNPTARYRYSEPHMHTPVAHKVSKIERIVADAATGEILARETKYARKPYWFFIGLGAPAMLCPAPGQDPDEKYGVIYERVLKPKSLP